MDPCTLQSAASMHIGLKMLELLVGDANESRLAVFGPLLAQRLGEEACPVGFVLAYRQQLEELRTMDANGLGPQEQHDCLIGQPATVYDALDRRLPEVARMVCSPSFARAVGRFYHEVNDNLGKHI